MVERARKMEKKSDVQKRDSSLPISFTYPMLFAVDHEVQRKKRAQWGVHDEEGMEEEEEMHRERKRNEKFR